MSQFIVTDIRKCVACKACEMACALEHSSSRTLEEAVHERPRPQSRVSVLSSGDYCVPLQCRHCEDAPCILVCPTTAMHRGEANGPVLVNRDRCIGCRACLVACPFGAIDMAGNGKAVTKCDLCVERGRQALGPACVESCPTHAMQVGDPPKLNLERRRQSADQACTHLEGDL